MKHNAMQGEVQLHSLHMIQRGLVTGIPIMLGYLPVAITYGVLAKQAGMTLLEIGLMSLMVYAGAAQFMAVNMLAVGTGIIEIVIATFVLNFRHFVMSLSFMNQLRGIALKWKVPLSLGLTDESFAVSAMNPEEVKKENGILFYAVIFLIAYLSWFVGSLLGGILGDVIPDNLSQSMGIALYAMFIGLLVPSVKKDLKVGLIAILSMLINALCIQIGFSTGWAIVIGTVIGGILFVTGVIPSILASFQKKLKKVRSIIISTAATAIGINVLIGEQYLSILLTGETYKGIYEKAGLPNKVLSRTLEDAGTVINPLVPWSVCGVFIADVLGVAVLDYLPFAFFCLLSPIITILFGGRRVSK